MVIMPTICKALENMTGGPVEGRGPEEFLFFSDKNTNYVFH